MFGNEKARPVLLLHDMNGASWNCLKLAQEVSKWGFRVYVPNLFAGEGMTFGSSDVFAAARYIDKNSDWKVHSMHNAGLIVEDIACMTREISRRHGQQVIVIGNCLTGIHPLGVLDEACVSKVALCQPATPLTSLFQLLLGTGQGQGKRRSLGLSENEVNSALLALKASPRKKIAAFHYLNDPVAPIERLEALHTKLAAQGLAGRMKTYVLKPAAEPAQRWWTRHDTTTAKTGIAGPHSTIVNASSPEDLKWFRAHLKEFLLTP